MRNTWKPRKRDVISVEKCKLNDGRTAYRIRWQLLPGQKWHCSWAYSWGDKGALVDMRYDEILEARRPSGIASSRPIFGTPPND